MATIVTNVETGGTYILLGGGYGAYQSARPSAFLGNLSPQVSGAEHSLALVTDASGQLGWVEVAKLQVVSVDGRSPAETLDG